MRRLLCGCVLALSIGHLGAQDVSPRDSVQVNTDTTTVEVARVEAMPLPSAPVLSREDSALIAQSAKVAESVANPWQPRSGKALLWAIIPGGGQIYNRKYWKVPIVWGSLATCAYFISFNGRMYDEYHTAYRDLMSSDPATNTAWLAFAPAGAKPEDYAQYSHLKSTLERGNEYYRRYRDLSIVLAIGLYGLSMLDAYVDAELFTFDISPDLSMRVTPSVALPTPLIPSYQMGVACSFTF